mgnify:CR=1 FL=1
MHNHLDCNKHCSKHVADGAAQEAWAMVYSPSGKRPAFRIKLQGCKQKLSHV